MALGVFFGLQCPSDATIGGLVGKLDVRA